VPAFGAGGVEDFLAAVDFTLPREPALPALLRSRLSPELTSAGTTFVLGSLSFRPDGFLSTGHGCVDQCLVSHFGQSGASITEHYGKALRKSIPLRNFYIFSGKHYGRGCALRKHYGYGRNERWWPVPSPPAPCPLAACQIGGPWAIPAATSASQPRVCALAYGLVGDTAQFQHACTALLGPLAYVTS